jgi:hypothetical protein
VPVFVPVSMVNVLPAAVDETPVPVMVTEPAVPFWVFAVLCQVSMVTLAARRVSPFRVTFPLSVYRLPFRVMMPPV